MAVKKDLSIKYLGVHCENPFFLSSSPVGGNYEMVKKAYEAGWAGVFFKTVGVFVADECSPRFDQTNKEGLPSRFARAGLDSIPSAGACNSLIRAGIRSKVRARAHG